MRKLISIAFATSKRYVVAAFPTSDERKFVVIESSDILPCVFEIIKFPSDIGHPQDLFLDLEDSLNEFGQLKWRFALVDSQFNTLRPETED